MAFLLGGPKCWKKRKASGGLMVFFEWWDDASSSVGKGECAMLLTRADKFGLSGNRGSACITLPQAHLYADSRTGAPTMRLIEFSRQACIELGFEPSRMNVKAIADAVVDNLPDLVGMPPEPDPDKFASRKARPVGEVSLIADGKTILEGEVH